MPCWNLLKISNLFTAQKEPQVKNNRTKNDAFIKIRAETESKMTCIESVPKFVQIWTIFLSATFSSGIFGIFGNLFCNRYSHICFADNLFVKHFHVFNFLILTNLINQFIIIYNYILILFNQTEITFNN